MSVDLSGENKKQLWVPEGFAHGFLVTSEEAIVSYKVTNYYNKENELAINYNDEELAIDWPNTKTKRLSQKDSLGLSLANFRDL